MAGTASQAPVAAQATIRPGQAAMDFVNGHGALSDSPASSSAPPPPVAKKGKGKKAVDPSETGKLLAAKINQLELDAAGDKEQEAEIGRYKSFFFTPEMLCAFTEIWLWCALRIWPSKEFKDLTFPGLFPLAISIFVYISQPRVLVSHLWQLEATRADRGAFGTVSIQSARLRKLLGTYLASFTAWNPRF